MTTRFPRLSQNLEVPSLVSRTVRGSGPSQDVLSIVLPLVQCRAPPWRHLDANPRAGPLRERRSGHCRQEIRAPRSMGRSSRTLRQRCAEAQTAPGGRLHQSSHPFPHHTGHCSLINPVECPIVVDRFRFASNTSLSVEQSRELDWVAPEHQPGRPRSAPGSRAAMPLAMSPPVPRDPQSHLPHTQGSRPRRGVARHPADMPDPIRRSRIRDRRAFARRRHDRIRSPGA